MQFIPMNILEYRLNEDGITETINVALQSYQGSEQFSARVSINDEYVKSFDEAYEVDKLNREQVEDFARLKLRDWVMTMRPAEVDPEDEITE